MEQKSINDTILQTLTLFKNILLVVGHTERDAHAGALKLLSQITNTVMIELSIAADPVKTQKQLQDIASIHDVFNAFLSTIPEEELYNLWQLATVQVMSEYFAHVRPQLSAEQQESIERLIVQAHKESS